MLGCLLKNYKIYPEKSGFFICSNYLCKKSMSPKHPSESLTILTDLVLPSETNPLNNLFGGELLARMDRAASIAARRHSRRITVTASVNHVAFNKSIPLGSVVTVEAKVSRAFTSSMEIYLDVWIEDRESGIRTKANEAIYTFVAVNETGNPVPVPQLIPETEEEKARFDAALRRKQLSLVLAGKMNPHDATELKALFV
ncbi:acyl-CoA hydrolase [Flavobacterium dankookense]|uniref:Acyl-CoA hydrolase n=2 Tax=Flavobacterium dankookense TaxID=706186 RepID=A0A4R6QCD0_9FLAO|nr:acyl-CoA hydrolase [Flavobacterium dankookense]